MVSTKRSEPHDPITGPTKPANLGTPATPYFAYALLGKRTGVDQLRPRFWLTVDGRAAVVESTEVLTPGWHFVAGTYDGAAMRIYVDGIERGRIAASGAIARYATPLRIGANGAGRQPFLGRIDNVRIYDRAQTLAEIQAEMPRPVL